MQPTFIFLSFFLLLYRLSLIFAAPTPSLIQLLDGIINTTITASTLNSPPPSILMTTIHSQECVNVNQGELLCCESIVDGDQPAVVMAADLFDFRLNRDSVNGLGCKDLDDGGYCPVLEHRLCCQVTDLMVLPLVSLAMWCHGAE
ncbi:hypothetical protein EAF04_001120 [Stromatinia cepivora]|nr:hypothetical protein EAF04_001120 [Stromatinia cepivora]